METGAVDERMRFVLDVEEAEDSMAELCRQYGISRQTGHKWWRRFQTAGIEGLKDESRAPREHPNAVTAQHVEAIIGMRVAHPHWGPRKIVARLERERPGEAWPASSTVGEILSRAKLVLPRHVRRHCPPMSQPFAMTDGPNATWCCDFKGWFKTGDGTRCDPFTLTDAYSRYLFRCVHVKRTDGPHVRGIMETAFKEYGLPRSIRSDNGSPFASVGIGGLSRLSVWWIRLGIQPERIEPGKPSQNGRHERMHKTLKLETAKPPAWTVLQQQRRFDLFRTEYNDIRPHEALDQKAPASVYECSARAYPKRLPELEYPSGTERYRVRVHGQFAWKGQEVFLGEALAGQWIGLLPTDDRYSKVLFGPIVLGYMDKAQGKIVHVTKHKRVSTMCPV
jgi:transposase InsO family protein